MKTRPLQRSGDQALLFDVIKIKGLTLWMTEWMHICKPGTRVSNGAFQA
jgi:hypothetical protein